MSLLSIQFSKVRSISLVVAICLFSVFPFLVAAESLTTYARNRFDGQSVIFTTSSGQRLRITPYGISIVRVQAVRKGEDFYSDDHYEMIESHRWDGFFTIADHGSFFILDTGGDTPIEDADSFTPGQNRWN